MLVDLHTHTSASDGELTASELIARACEQGLDILSITDHDTCAAYELISTKPASLTLIPGIEFSSNWEKTEIHILGLNVQLGNSSLNEGIHLQQQRRVERAHKIAEKLARHLKIANPLEQCSSLSEISNPGRPHFAKYLLQQGLVKTIEEAFKKYLNPGKPAYVKTGWADVEQVIDWINSAGGTAVLAHPKKYQLTRTKLLRLLDEFCRAGGRGLEVICGQQNPTVTRELAKLCEQRQLLASCGSDFHRPGLSWSELGRFSTLPRNCQAIWEHW